MGKLYTKKDLETFANVYVRSGGNGYDAYKAMRPDSRGSKEAVRVMVAKLLKRQDVVDLLAREAVRADGSRVICKRRLNELLTETVEQYAADGRLLECHKLIDTLCKMNGFYEAQKVEVRHGALEEDARSRALRSLQQAGMDVVDALPAVRKEPNLLEAAVDGVQGGEVVEIEDLRPVDHAGAGQPKVGTRLLDKVQAAAELTDLRRVPIEGELLLY